MCIRDRITLWQLQALADKSLVETTATTDKDAAVHYHLPALIRQYAAEKLARRGELHTQVRAAYLDYLYNRMGLRGAIEFITTDGQRPTGLTFAGPSRGLLSEHYIMA